MNSNKQQFPEHRNETTSSFPVQGPPQNRQSEYSGQQPNSRSPFFSNVGQSQGTQNPFINPQPVPQFAPPPGNNYQVAPVAQSKNNTVLIIVLILVVLLFTVTLIAVFFGLSKRSDSTSASSSQSNSDYVGQDAEQQQYPVEQDSVPTEEEMSETKEEDRAEDFKAPASWKLCGGSGAPGDLNLVYSATDVTTCPFSNNVRDAFVRKYLDDGSLNSTVEAVSPVTKKSYTMRCRDDGTVVTCKGGNNAVVVIV